MTVGPGGQSLKSALDATTVGGDPTAARITLRAGRSGIAARGQHKGGNSEREEDEWAA